MKQKKTHKTHNRGKLWLAVIILSIGICVLGILYYTTWSEYRKQINLTHASEMKYIKSNKEVGSLEREIATLKSKKNLDEFEMLNLKQKISGSYPIIISDIKIANSYRQGTIETDYGNTIYSVNTMFLKPRITYYGLTSGTKTFHVKWFKPDGSVCHGTDSPYGFTQSNNYNIIEGANNTITMDGWGNDNKGNWKSGTYRIEIWFGNVCLKSKTFTIY